MNAIANRVACGNPQADFEAARRRALAGSFEEARGALRSAGSPLFSPKEQALIHNDLGAIARRAAMRIGRTEFSEALAIDPDCDLASANWICWGMRGATHQRGRLASGGRSNDSEPAIRIAVVSFLFSWPSTAGGIVHTSELCKFLSRAGYAVCHFYARYNPWELGQVDGTYFENCQPIEFSERGLECENDQAPLSRAIDEFDPDYVIINR